MNTILGIGTLIATAAVAPETTMTMELAKEKAYTHAGVVAESVLYSNSVLDIENDFGEVDHYDVEFVTNNTEYEYDIDATTGAVLGFSSEFYTLMSAQAPVAYITQEKAVEIALAQGNFALADVVALNVEFDIDDGFAGYELEWIANFAEYECTVDAVTGTIYEYERD